MSYLTANGLPVFRAIIALPEVGRWSYEVDVDADDADDLTGTVTLAAEDGSLTLVGTAYVPPGGAVQAGTSDDGRTRVKVVAGAGGLFATVDAKAYEGVPLRLVLDDLLLGAGETLSDTADADILNHYLDRWTRCAGDVRGALRMLRTAAGAGYRFEPDGTLWIGVDTYPEVEVEHIVTAEDTGTGKMTISPDTLALLPGTTFLDRRVSYVLHEVGEGGISTTVTFDKGNDPLEDAIRQATADAAFSRRYAAEVVEQHASGKVSLRLDSALMPELDNVPISYGLPGVRAEVDAGARCRVEFVDGNPQKPEVVGWEHDGLSKLIIADGTQRLAREGDSVHGGWLSATCPAGTVTFAYSAGPVGPAIPLSSGVISSGSDEVDA
jgi:hypothetical protein